MIGSKRLLNTPGERAELFFDYDCRVELDAWREERLVWDGIR